MYSDEELFAPITAADPTAFEKAQANVPRARRIFHSLALDIAEHVAARLAELGQNARWLAQRLGKRDSEISKWLSGTHNLTLDSVAKLADALDEDLLVSPRFQMGFFGQPMAPALVTEVPLKHQPASNVFMDFDWRGGSYDATVVVGSDVLLPVAADEYSFSLAA